VLAAEPGAVATASKRVHRMPAQDTSNIKHKKAPCSIKQFASEQGRLGIHVFIQLRWSTLAA